MVQHLFDFIKSSVFLAIFNGILSYSFPPKAWKNLLKNIYFRFIFITALVYQTDERIDVALLVSTSTLLFFYMIKDKKERKETFKDLTKQDIKTFAYLLAHIFILSKIIKKKNK